MRAKKKHFKRLVCTWEGEMRAIHVYVDTYVHTRKVWPNNPFFCPGYHGNNLTQISRFIEEKYTRKRNNDRGM